MCCRYYVDDDTLDKVSHDLGIVRPKERSSYAGDIHPTDSAPVITSGDKHSTYFCTYCWGYAGIGGRDVIINARSETVQEKRMFISGITRNRILIPAAHFYEWDSQKTKYIFRRSDAAVMYLAGIVDRYDGAFRFVILTTQANDSMVRVHNRMPLILERDQLLPWLCDDGAVESILKQTPVQLERQAEHEQLSFF